VFERETVFTRWLHNYTAFSLQRRLFLRGLPCAIVPVRVLAPETLAGGAAAAVPG
jgi:hypothetical protein